MLVQNRLIAIGYIVLGWMLAGVVITLHEHFFLSNYPDISRTAAMADYSFSKNGIAAIVSLGIAGLLFSWMEIRIFKDHLIKVNFLKAIVIKVSTYLIGLFLLLILISFLYNSVLSGRSIFDVQVRQHVGDFIFSISILHPIGPTIVLALLTSFLIQLSERLGPTELWKLLVGRYMRPREEERIFMFLDMNKSTAIAEKLGNKKFHDLLNDFFHDLANTIVASKGEVVEYVGDLVVITWKLDVGVKNRRCLHSYSSFVQSIAKRRTYYQKTYGLFPGFKAALHCGKVVVGEMGRIKKTLRFTGDVLNTSSRIEKLAGERGVKLAISGELVQQLQLTEPDTVRKLQGVTLRGKKSPVHVYEVVGM